MKVIAKGSGQKGWSTQTKCTGGGNGGGGCGAELLVEQPDLFTTSSSDMGGDTETHITFKCCECGVLTDLKNVPYAIKATLPTKRAFEGGGPGPWD